MRFAYADPPYLGQAKRHYGDRPDYGGEVDHAELITRLVRDYDGWALSASSVSLVTLFRLQTNSGAYVLPETVRVGAWVKPFASFKPGINPAYAWEPVLFVPGRNGMRDVPTVRDWVSANITLETGVHGAKPPQFSLWIFDLLGMTPQDDFDDLYYGSGAVTQAWRFWRAVKLDEHPQLPLLEAA
jgi:hypothetical protein